MGRWLDRWRDRWRNRYGIIGRNAFPGRVRQSIREAREIAKAITEYTYRRDTGTRTDNWNCRSAYANRSIPALLTTPRASNLPVPSFNIAYTSQYRRYSSYLSVSELREIGDNPFADPPTLTDSYPSRRCVYLSTKFVNSSGREFARRR